MPDGTVIAYPKAKDTFVETVKRIGPERIRPLGLRWCKVPLISNTVDGTYPQTHVGGGWYLITHSGTAVKRKQLLKIADLLHLPLRVEILPS